MSNFNIKHQLKYLSGILILSFSTVTFSGDELDSKTSITDVNNGILLASATENVLLAGTRQQAHRAGQLAFGRQLGTWGCLGDFEAGPDGAGAPLGGFSACYDRALEACLLEVSPLTTDRPGRYRRGCNWAHKRAIRALNNR